MCLLNEPFLTGPVGGCPMNKIFRPNGEDYTCHCHVVTTEIPDRNEY